MGAWRLCSEWEIVLLPVLWENRKTTAHFPEREEIFSESWEIWPTAESMCDHIPPLRATIDPNYQKLFSQSLIVEISRKRAPLESDREHFWGIHFYNFPLFSSLLKVDLLASGASLVWPRPLTSWSALDLCTFAYPSKDTTDFESLFE